MWQMKFQKVSTWDIAYAVDMSIACLITYWLTAFLIPYMGRPATPVGILWAVISTVFVYKDTRSHSLAAGISRLAATLISLLLCLSYLSLFPIISFGMAVLIAIGTLIAMSLGRRDDIGLTAITTAVVMIVAASEPQNAWLQPLLRLVDTMIGITVGVACKWAASFMFTGSPGKKRGDVRCGSKADIGTCPRDVRFAPESGHWLSVSQCPLCANSGHQCG